MKCGTKVVDRLCLTGAHVEVEDGPALRPVPLRLDGKDLKQVAATFEEAMQGGDQQRLAEAPGAGREELKTNAVVDKRKDKPVLST